MSLRQEQDQMVKLITTKWKWYASLVLETHENIKTNLCSWWWRIKYKLAQHI